MNLPIDKFKAFTQNGCLKEVTITTNSFENVLTIPDKIQSLTLSSIYNEAIVSTINGNVHQCNIHKNDYQHLFNFQSVKTIKPIHFYKWANKYCGIFSNGNIDFFSTEGKLESRVSCGKDCCVSLLSNGGENNGDARLVTAGKENDVNVWNIDALYNQGRIKEDAEDIVVTETLSAINPLFTAKNVPQTNIKLRRPVWPRTAMFLPQSQEQVILVGTAFGEIRLYDSRGPQRRPMKELIWTPNGKDFQHGITALSPSPANSTQEFFAGNSAGKLGEFDLRKFRSSLYHYKGLGAGVVNITCPRNEPQALYSMSADGFLQIFDRETRDAVFKLYLISKPLGLWLDEETRVFEFLNRKDQPRKVKKRVIEDFDLEEVWKSMESTTKKKQKTNC